MSSLLDTNILSESRRPRPEPRVNQFLSSTPLHQLYISSITLAEIRYGIAKAANQTRKHDLELWLQNDIRPTFSGRILEITEDTMLRWRLLVESGRRVGKTYSQPDLLIAALALEHDMTLVTRNTRDFAGLGLTLINPWTL